MDTCQSPFNIMRDLDSKMVKFFHSVLRRELTKRSYEGAFEELIRAYSKDMISAGESDICFNSPDIRCAYVYNRCALIATSTAYHFMQFLKGNTFLLQKITFSDSFQVCCLGGGPGTEIVAIAKILDGLLSGYCSTRRKPLLIKATIIDKDSGWSVTAENVVKSLSQILDTSLVRCELNFIESNLTEPFTKQVKDAIEEADFITMVKFLSCVHGSKYRHRIHHMLQEIISRIKDDAVLFFSDTAFSDPLEAVKKAMESFPDMSETYGPVLYDLYKMSFYSVAESIKLRKNFGDRLPTFTILNHVGAWSKGSKVPNPGGDDSTGDKYDAESMAKEIERHVSKCLKFCFPRQEDVGDFVMECTFEGKGLFSTKPKDKRVEGTLKI